VLQHLLEVDQVDVENEVVDQNMIGMKVIYREVSMIGWIHRRLAMAKMIP
jgi:hypothetical protein